jgi:hypothetical protein
MQGDEGEEDRTEMMGMEVKMQRNLQPCLASVDTFFGADQHSQLYIICINACLKLHICCECFRWRFIVIKKRQLSRDRIVTCMSYGNDHNIKQRKHIVVSPTSTPVLSVSQRMARHPKLPFDATSVL